MVLLLLKIIISIYIMVAVLLSASIKRVGVSCMRDFLIQCAVSMLHLTLYAWQCRLHITQPTLHIMSEKSNTLWHLHCQNPGQEPISWQTKLYF